MSLLCNFLWCLDCFNLFSLLLWLISYVLVLSSLSLILSRLFHKSLFLKRISLDGWLASIVVRYFLHFTNFLLCFLVYHNRFLFLIFIQELFWFLRKIFSSLLSASFLSKFLFRFNLNFLLFLDEWSQDKSCNKTDGERNTEIFEEIFC